MAHPSHDRVRTRYAGRCGYCGVWEVDVGGELTVDHYRPVSAGGDDSEDNLVYCCARCNRYKADFTPTAQQIALGQRVLHPLRDRVEDHFEVNEPSGMLVPRTDTGRFHLALLHLNRPALVAHRLQARDARNREDSFTLLAQRIVVLESAILTLMQIVDGLVLLQRTKSNPHERE